MSALVLRDVELRRGVLGDVRIEGGRIAAVGQGLSGDMQLDGRCGALLPGLADHHIHLLGLAAQADSVAFDDVDGPSEFERRLRDRLANCAPGLWLRATGYHETTSGPLDRRRLDALAPEHPVRVQHQSGALWILNSAALRELAGGEPPPFLELETGWLWRGDAWLKGRLPPTPPPLAPVGSALAACGVTSVMDASVTNDAESAAILAAAVREGALPQKVGLMSGGALPQSQAYSVGPVKVLLDEHDLPDFDEMLTWIRRARTWRRKVAVHCVTAAELAFTLAAFETAGSVPGDRIEHGGVVHPEAALSLAALGLTVVTQPAFIAERGDRYLAEAPPEDHDSLYPCAGLLASGVRVAGSSDAPYGGFDPWAAMRAATQRRTRIGRIIGEKERLSSGRALALFLGDLEDPGGPPRRLQAGAAADLCLLAVPLDVALRKLDQGLVAATLVGGRVVYAKDGSWPTAA